VTDLAGSDTALTADASLCYDRPMKAERGIFEIVDLDAEAAADTRADADVESGRVVDHDKVAA
jgi:predicted transcriptional regulator